MKCAVNTEDEEEDYDDEAIVTSMKWHIMLFSRYLAASSNIFC